MNNFNGIKPDSEIFEATKNNCYTYAINQPSNPYTKEPYKTYDHCQPGYLGGEVSKEGKLNSDFSNIIDCVKADLFAIGYEMNESSLEEYIENESAWKIACAYTFINTWEHDYHFYRQDKDGLWTHKKGRHNVCIEDVDGQLIKDPENCNRGKYEIFIGYFMIVPIEKVEEDVA
jgi:hypothetical protein